MYDVLERAFSHNVILKGDCIIRYVNYAASDLRPGLNSWGLLFGLRLYPHPRAQTHRFLLINRLTIIHAENDRA
jgi:hypothetical protein